MIKSPSDFDPNVAAAQQSTFIVIDNNTWMRQYFDSNTWKTDTYVNGEVNGRISAEQLMTQEDTEEEIAEPVSIMEKINRRQLIMNVHVSDILKPISIEPIKELIEEPIIKEVKP
jgi:hypothetical protein